MRELRDERNKMLISCVKLRDLAKDSKTKNKK